MTVFYYEDVATKLNANMSATRPGTMDVVHVVDLSGTTLAVQFDVRVENELLRVTSIAVDTPVAGIDRWSVNHLGGAAASTHAAGQEVEVMLTAHALNNDLAPADDDSAYALLAGATFTGAVEFEGGIVDPSESTGSDGNVLAKVSGAVAWHAPVLADHTDVDLTGFDDGDVLTYVTADGKWEAKDPTAGSSSLSGLSDVDLTEVASAKGDLLVYNLADTKWENLPVGTNGYVLEADSTQELGVKWASGGGGGSSTLAGDTDVSLTSPAEGDILTYNATDAKWENVPGIAGSDEIVIPGLAADPDQLPASPSASDNEFGDSTGASWATFNSLTGADEDTTAKSHAYLHQNSNGSTDAFKGIILSAAAPATPFTATFKISGAPSSNGCWLVAFVSDSATAAGNAVAAGPFAGRLRSGVFTNLQTLGGFSGGNYEEDAGGGSAARWIKIKVNSTTSVDVSVSYDGITYGPVRNYNPGFGGTRYVGVAIDAYSAAAQMICDYVRFS